MQHANASVAAPSSVKPGVPEIIDDIVLWATEREPDERPKDAGELLAAVRQAKKIISATTTNSRTSQNRTTVIPVSEQTGEANSTQVLNLNQTPSQAATQILRVADLDPEDLPVASEAQTQILNREMMHDSSPQVQACSRNFDRSGSSFAWARCRLVIWQRPFCAISGAVSCWPFRGSGARTLSWLSLPSHDSKCQLNVGANWASHQHEPGRWRHDLGLSG